VARERLIQAIAEMSDRRRKIRAVRQFHSSSVGGVIPVELVKVKRMIDIGDTAAWALTKANGEKPGLSRTMVLWTGSAFWSVLASSPLDLTVAA
jgi:hypothetical protein